MNHERTKEAIRYKSIKQLAEGFAEIGLSVRGGRLIATGFGDFKFGDIRIGKFFQPRVVQRYILNHLITVGLLKVLRKLRGPEGDPSRLSISLADRVKKI